MKWTETVCPLRLQTSEDDTQTELQLVSVKCYCMMENFYFSFPTVDHSRLQFYASPWPTPLGDKMKLKSAYFERHALYIMVHNDYVIRRGTSPYTRERSRVESSWSCEEVSSQRPQAVPKRPEAHAEVSHLCEVTDHSHPDCPGRRRLSRHGPAAGNRSFALEADWTIGALLCCDWLSPLLVGLWLQKWKLATPIYKNNKRFKITHFIRLQSRQQV